MVVTCTCNKCYQVGIHNGRTVWPYRKDVELRTDTGFANFQYQDHQRALTILSEIKIGLVTQVPVGATYAFVVFGFDKKN